MSKLNYNTAEEFVRNITDVQGVEIHHTEGLFRIVKVPAPYYQGREWWVVNEKGFFWEPVGDLFAGLEYLKSEEAQSYKGLDSSRHG